MHARGWAHEDVLFVDDSLAHIEKARRARRTRQLPPCALRVGPMPTTVILTMCQAGLPHAARDG